MFTHIRISGVDSAATHVTGRNVRAGYLAAVALALVGCGSGGSNSAAPEIALTPPTASTPPPAPTTAPKGQGSVIISAVTTTGTPISGLGVALNGGFDSPMMTTDSNGEATFKELPTGDARAVLWGSGYHGASRSLTVTDGSVTKVSVTLEHVTEATPVVLASHAVASNDGKTLTVDLNIAVLDENGMARETLTAADFALVGACDWGWCVVDANGTDTNGWYNARVDDATFHPLPTEDRPTMAAAILLEQSADVALIDPAGMRLQAVNGFLESITPPDTVTVGSYQGTAATPTLAIHGGFTSDTASLRTTVSALADQERGTNPMHAALAEMISFTAANTPPGSSTLQRSVVAVVNTWPMEECADAKTCWQAKRAVTEAAQASDVSVIAIGTDGPAAEIASRTQGAFAYVQDPAQLSVVFHRLGSIVGRSLAYTRVRLQLESAPGTFLPGHTVQGYLTVRIGPDTSLVWSLYIPM